MAEIIIPTPLRKFADNQATIAVAGDNILSAIEDLVTQFPDLKKQIFDAQGQIKRFIRIYKGEDDIESLDNEKTAIEADTVISIIPAIAGGAN
ncbi:MULTISPECIES: MoaD/ThiS family protein [Reichenbachiella]|uniref:Molybdopterin synthase subunit MoaD n=1 Tax=Reichenbachiella agariperforans TaxID=156994 RepID=A0A1M6J9H8_REIAG|nr:MULTISPECIES: MoaD/ThiS family protein [Reichenbachiella]MBU2913114.1 MoaD/ThiS family protein [Reichenbachiella agariperforans]PIB35650.1 molybdopterin synthase sulfur carrier subunit [Reichenbachiella sp. 5M10]SHJ43339.1 molybdopterin synthase subunit MoaD [Reichenbachiella agariperforans]